MKKVLFLTFITILLILGCAKEPELDTPEEGFGFVSGKKVEKGWQGAVFTMDMFKKNQVRFGLMDVHFLEISDKMYVVDWSDLNDYKITPIGLKTIHFRSTGFIIRTGPSMQNLKDYRVITITLPVECEKSPNPCAEAVKRQEEKFKNKK